MAMNSSKYCSGKDSDAGRQPLAAGVGRMQLGWEISLETPYLLNFKPHEILRKTKLKLLLKLSLLQKFLVLRQLSPAVYPASWEL